MKLALEAERVLGDGHGEERAADGARDRRRLVALAEVETELDEHAADAARLGIVGSPRAN